MNEVQILKELYVGIPAFQCITGCTDCCGPIPFSKVEWERVSDRRTAKALACPYSTNGRCDIYQQRPFMCRLYGTAPDLRCPYGCRPKVLLTEEQEHSLTQRYLDLMRGEQA